MINHHWFAALHLRINEMTQAGLEPAALCSGGRCSNPLSYWAREIIFADLNASCQYLSLKWMPYKLDD